MNSLAIKLGKSPVFELTQMERMASSGVLGFPNKQINIAKRWIQWGFQETLIGWSFLIFICLYLIVQIFGKDVGAENLWTEFWGLIFDVLIILVGFGLIQNWKQKRETIERQHELIEDFKRWESDEAKHRILGAIRRLNRLGVTKVNLTGAKLKGLNFRSFGIESIKGSLLSGGSFLDEELKCSTFTSVDFSRLNCDNVVFNIPNLFNKILLGDNSKFLNCNFWEADLRNAKFDGATISEDTTPPIELEEIMDVDDDGRPHFARTIAHSFNDTDLFETSFKFCQFKNVDFRLANNIHLADFRGATGLETCVFDDGLKEQIIANSKEPIND
jgi:uncharacterized protein YjbI with pentapeptide repeats